MFFSHWPHPLSSLPLLVSHLPCCANIAFHINCPFPKAFFKLQAQRSLLFNANILMPFLGFLHLTGSMWHSERECRSWAHAPGFSNLFLSHSPDAPQPVPTPGIPYFPHQSSHPQTGHFISSSEVQTCLVQHLNLSPSLSSHFALPPRIAPIKTPPDTQERGSGPWVFLPNGASFPSASCVSQFIYGIVCRMPDTPITTGGPGLRSTSGLPTTSQQAARPWAPGW